MPIVDEGARNIGFLGYLDQRQKENVNPNLSATHLCVGLINSDGYRFHRSRC